MNSFLKQQGTCVSMFFVVCASTLFCVDLFSAPLRNSGPYYAEDNAKVIKDLRDSLEGMKHEVSNHEAEIRMFDEKLGNFDTIIESVRDQLNEASKSQKDQLKGSTATLDEKITSLETTTKGLVADLRQFKNHANDSTTILGQYKQKIVELEKIIEQQNQNIEHLQAAMRALMDALQVKDPTSASSTISEGRSYKIKPGDSLEKIAKAHQVTIQALKERNGLTSDKIVVGKVLQIPEK